jgi:hypothetical protein
VPAAKKMETRDTTTPAHNTLPVLQSRRRSERGQPAAFIHPVVLAAEEEEEKKKLFFRNRKAFLLVVVSITFFFCFWPPFFFKLFFQRENPYVHLFCVFHIDKNSKRDLCVLAT